MKAPGLVNAHSHSFQRAIRARTEHRASAGSDTFWTWREAMYRAANLLSPEDIYRVARMAFLEMALSGITTVGEFHYLHHAPDGSRYENPSLLAEEVLRAGREVGVRVVLLRTAYARAGFGKPANPRQARFITPDVDTFLRDTDDLRRTGVPIGIAPHSVRALPLHYLIEVTRYAREHKLPVHMHVAEQPAEIEECLAEYGLRPIELLREHGILDSSLTAVHAIHINAGEIEALGSAGARVCACPTTERNLGDGAVPADRLMAAGVGICFGSDSNAQIDLLEDARLLEYHLRMNRLERAILPVAELFRCATATGAAALGVDIAHGDFFTVDPNDPSIAGATADSLEANLVFALERTAIRDVYVNGRRIVANGSHPLQEEIVKDFAAVQQRLWETLE